MNVSTVTSAVVVALLAAGCTDAPTAAPPSQEDPRSGESTGPRSVGPTDYGYVLERSCFCAVTSPVRIEVRDGEVAAARFANGSGRRVPAYLRLTVEDLLAQARRDGVASARVLWPAASPVPAQVSIDLDREMSDDEVTWTIRSFRADDSTPTPIAD